MSRDDDLRRRRDIVGRAYAALENLGIHDKRFLEGFYADCLNDLGGELDVIDAAINSMRFPRIGNEEFLFDYAERLTDFSTSHKNIRELK